MSDNNSTELDIELTTRENLNHGYLLLNQILTFQKAILNKESSALDIENSISGLVNLIPTVLRSNDFDEKLKKCYVTEKIDIRPEFGGTKLSLDYCTRKGIPVEDEITYLKNPFDLLLVCIDQLQKLSMLSKRILTEMPTGMPTGSEALEEGQTLEDLIEREIGEDEVMGDNENG